MGGKDFDDITLGIDALVAKGLVDKDRVGMCGWSYGGYAAAWATTHAKRFAATVMGAGICDWDTFSRCVTTARFHVEPKATVLP
jgi:prolyl oligopeptidase